MTFGRVARAIVLFLLCVGGVTAVSHHLFDFPAKDGLGNRLRYVNTHPNDFDVAFLGSSVTLIGVDPTVFDDEVARSCRKKVRSVNLAVRGADGGLMDAITERLLTSSSASLRWIVIEMRTWDTDVQPIAQSNDRAFWLHSARETYESILDVSELDEPLSKRAVLAKDHLLHMAVHYFRIGKGAEIFAGMFNDAETSELRNRGAKLLSPDERGTPDERNSRNRLVRDLDRYRNDVANLASTPRDAVVLTARERARIQRRLDRVDETPINLLHFLVPNSNKRAQSLRSKSASLREILPGLVLLDDPVSQPELFAVPNRWDRVHLNSRGARAMTSALAKAFCDRTDTRSR